MENTQPVISTKPKTTTLRCGKNYSLVHAVIYSNMNVLKFKFIKQYCLNYDRICLAFYDMHADLLSIYR